MDAVKRLISLYGSSLPGAKVAARPVILSSVLGNPAEAFSTRGSVRDLTEGGSSGVTPAQREVVPAV